PSPTNTYPLSLHDALPIYTSRVVNLILQSVDVVGGSKHVPGVRDRLQNLEGPLNLVGKLTPVQHIPRCGLVNHRKIQGVPGVLAHVKDIGELLGEISQTVNGLVEVAED